MFFFGSKDIKFYVQRLIESRRDSLKGKTVLDLPAGNGVSAQQLHSLGAHVHAGDLFPEFFRVPDLRCEFVDLGRPFPYGDRSMDFILCQEGVEHVSDQYHVFCEFSRVLKDKGTLLVTIPNYSNLRSRLSYLLNESELMGKIMPPNEIESVWYAPGQEDKVYFGHVNLIGIQKLRLFAKLSGFGLVKVHPTRVNYTSMLLLPFFYPFIFCFSWAAYQRMKNKRGSGVAAKVREVFNLSISPGILLQGHLMVEFCKEKAPVKVVSSPERVLTEFVT
ncbi:bifunctional 3-demethylubiquinone-9 3-methyltransferase/ 2-octaprenyl-6-hydroxy phenol methylase [compost metagenome]